MTSGVIALLLGLLTAPSASPCSEVADRQLDFWVGRWIVRDAAGKVVGRSHVRRVAGGCALMEDWSGTDGFLGTSLSYREESTGRWLQTWVDSRRQRILYSGGPKGSRFELLSEHRTSQGKPVIIRMTLWAAESRRVRQRWEQSIDGGKTWRVDFDGTYSPG